ncbi:cytidine deaminase [Spiractinospora alimapuensis]|nr:cytidine deaminase [Spiractinospora alimapuensis]
MPTEPVHDLDPEDEKLITLARSSRARNSAAQGAAVRDVTRRTYVATTVDLPSLRLSAVRAAVAAAASSGAEGLQAVAVVGGPEDETELSAEDLAAVRDMGASVVLLASPDGTLRRVSRS